MPKLTPHPLTVKTFELEAGDIYHTLAVNHGGYEPGTLLAIRHDPTPEGFTGDAAIIARCLYCYGAYVQSQYGFTIFGDAGEIGDYQYRILGELLSPVADLTRAVG